MPDRPNHEPLEVRPEDEITRPLDVEQLPETVHATALLLSGDLGGLRRKEWTAEPGKVYVVLELAVEDARKIRLYADTLIQTPAGSR